MQAAHSKCQRNRRRDRIATRNELYTLGTAHPELLKQANPYSTAHGKYWMIDLTLYDGKYFLYWGPSQGILQALAKSALGITRLVGDQFLAFFFVSLSFISGPVSRRLRVAAGAAFGGCAIVTIMVGLSLGYQGYNGHVHRFNPKLDAQLRARLSVCGPSAPLAPQYAPRTPRRDL